MSELSTKLFFDQHRGDSIRHGGVFMTGPSMCKPLSGQALNNKIKDDTPSQNNLLVPILIGGVIITFLLYRNK